MNDIYSLKMMEASYTCRASSERKNVDEWAVSSGKPSSEFPNNAVWFGVSLSVFSKILAIKSLISQIFA